MARKFYKFDSRNIQSASERDNGAVFYSFCLTGIDPAFDEHSDALSSLVIGSINDG